MKLRCRSLQSQTRSIVFRAAVCCRAASTSRGSQPISYVLLPWKERQERNERVGQQRRGERKKKHTMKRQQRSSGRSSIYTDRNEQHFPFFDFFEYCRRNNQRNPFSVHCWRRIAADISSFVDSSIHEADIKVDLNRVITCVNESTKQRALQIFQEPIGPRPMKLSIGPIRHVIYALHHQINKSISFPSKKINFSIGASSRCVHDLLLLPFNFSSVPMAARCSGRITKTARFESSTTERCGIFAAVYCDPQMGA